MENKAEKVLKEIQKVIVGKEEVIKKVLLTLLADGHVLLEDVPGVGKTTIALCFHKVLGLDYKRISFTPDSVPADITGFSALNANRTAFEYHQGAVMTNLLLADEINRTSSKTQSALLEAMQERQITVDAKTYPLPNPFFVLATQNPIGSAGTQELPLSELDRFMIKVQIGYPDAESQVKILQNRQDTEPPTRLSPVLSKEELLLMKQEVSSVYVEESIYRYMTDLVMKTRDHEMVEFGVSPRGAIALCDMSKACAYVEGRDYVLPTDVANIFSDVCAHRLVLKRQAKLGGYDEKKVINEVLEITKQPPINIAGEKMNR